MNKITAYDGNTRFERISKVKAKQLFNAGKPIVFCPVKLYPFGGFRPSCMIQGDDDPHQEFADYVLQFQWYNCNCYETGYYTAFYVNSELI